MYIRILIISSINQFLSMDNLICTRSRSLGSIDNITILFTTQDYLHSDVKLNQFYLLFPPVITIISCIVVQDTKIMIMLIETIKRLF